MGILGSSLGRGLAGAGAAVADTANKYIDEQLAERRAQVIADIQRTSAVQQTKDIDAYTNAPERRAGLRTEASKDITAGGAAQLDVERSRVTDPGLLAGDVARTKAITTATGQAQGDVAKSLGNDPLYVSAERNIARAKHVDTAADAAHAALLSFQLGLAKQQSSLTSDLFKAIQSGDKDSEDKLTQQIDILQGKGGKADKFAKIAEQASAAMAPALRTLSDPTADESTKEQARTVLRQQQSLLQQAAKRAGFDLTEAAKTPIPQAAADALKADPSKAKDFDAKYGSGASAKILGSAPPTGKPSASGGGSAFGGTGVPIVDEAMGWGAPDPEREATLQGRRDAVKGLFSRAGELAGRAGDALAPDWEQQGQAALASRDKATIQRVLQQSQGGAKPLSPATRIKLQAALNAP